MGSPSVAAERVEGAGDMAWWVSERVVVGGRRSKKEREGARRKERLGGSSPSTAKSEVAAQQLRSFLPPNQISTPFPLSTSKPHPALPNYEMSSSDSDDDMPP